MMRRFTPCRMQSISKPFPVPWTARWGRPLHRGRGTLAQAGLRKFRQDRTAIGAIVVLIIIVLACSGASIFAKFVSQTDVFQSNLDGQITVGGDTLDIVQAVPNSLGVTPIGPTWRGQYFLGADNQGRDVAARMLYGRQNSLIISIPFPGADSIFSSRCGAISGRLRFAVRRDPSDRNALVQKDRRSARRSPPGWRHKNKYRTTT